MFYLIECSGLQSLCFPLIILFNLDFKLEALQIVLFGLN